MLNIYNGSTSGTVNLGSGPTASGQTVNVNLGTNGLSGSTTNVNLGSNLAGATSIITANGNFRGQQIAEACQFISSVNTNSVTVNASLGQIAAMTMTSLTSNFTLNITNLGLASGYCTTFTLICVQGGTGYYPSTFQIDGTTQTVNTSFFWQGGSTPVGSANKRDVIAYNITNNGGTYVTYAQLVSWG